MDDRFRSIAALAAQQHSVVSLRQLIEAGVSASSRSRWVDRGVLDRLGPRSFALAGSDPTWRRRLTSSWFDLDGAGVIAGRSAARLMELDGFAADDVELCTVRATRHRSPGGVLRSTRRPLVRSDLQRIDGLVVVRAERLVLDAMIDTGGESRLERWFLQLCRSAGLPRPHSQTTFRADECTIARVDFVFPDGLIVEVEGHATHSSRRQRQRDEERRTALTLQGERVIAFTYLDVRDRPDWVAAQLRRAVVPSGVRNVA
jgi:hypothetical protein